MKNKTIISLMLILSTSSFAQTVDPLGLTPKTETKKEIIAATEKVAAPKTNPYYEVSSVDLSILEGVQFSANTLLGTFKKDGSNDSFGVNGYGFGVAKEFDLSSIATTATSLRANFYKLSEKHNLDPADIKHEESSAKDFGVSQKISLLREHKGVIFKPFLEAGLSLGSTHFEGNELQGSNSMDYDIEIDYTRVSYALGVEAQLINNLVPFIKYERSDIQMDKKAVSEFHSDRLSMTSTNDIEKIRMSSNTFTLGIGYQF